MQWLWVSRIRSIGTIFLKLKKILRTHPRLAIERKLLRVSTIPKTWYQEVFALKSCSEEKESTTTCVLVAQVVVVLAYPCLSALLIFDVVVAIVVVVT